jgi:hypothetical protein
MNLKIGKKTAPYMLRWEDGSLINVDGVATVGSLAIHPTLDPMVGLGGDRKEQLKVLIDEEGIIPWFYTNYSDDSVKLDIRVLVITYIMLFACRNFDVAQYYPLFVSKNIRKVLFELDPEKMYAAADEAYSLLSITEGEPVKDIKKRLLQLYEKLIIKTNSDFARVRLGGRYYSNLSGKQDIYFRISDTTRNWYDKIWAVVNENKNILATVTIEIEDDYYTRKIHTAKIKGKAVSKMPVDEFLTISGRPVVEELDELDDALSIEDWPTV